MIHWIINFGFLVLWCFATFGSKNLCKRFICDAICLMSSSIKCISQIKCDHTHCRKSLILWPNSQNWVWYFQVRFSLEIIWNQFEIELSNQILKFGHKLVKVPQCDVVTFVILCIQSINHKFQKVNKSQLKYFSIPILAYQTSVTLHNVTKVLKSGQIL